MKLIQLQGGGGGECGRPHDFFDLKYISNYKIYTECFEGGSYFNLRSKPVKYKRMVSPLFF